MGRRGLALAGALLALTLNACGGNDKFEAKELKDGAATGTAYTFKLPDGWKLLDLTDKGDRELAGEITDAVKGLDTKGILVDGIWARPSDDKLKPLVSVAVEAATEDSELTTIGKSTVGLIGAAGGDEAVQIAQPGTLGTESAFAVKYFRGENELRLVTAKHGPLVYSLTVQMKNGNTKTLDALTSSIAKAWRWTPPTAAGQAKLARLAKFSSAGYSVTLPPGWRGTGKKALEDTGIPNLDSLWRGYISTNYSTNVTVGVTSHTGSAAGLADAVIADERKRAGKGGAQLTLESIGKDGKIQLDGVTADVIDVRSKLANGVRLHQREVVALRAGRLYQVTLSSQTERFATDAPQFDAALKTWQWR